MIEYQMKLTHTHTHIYKPIINKVINKRWMVDPLMVIMAGVRAATHHRTICYVHSPTQKEDREQ